MYHNNVVVLIRGMIIPLILIITGSDVKLNPLVVALHEYEPLSDCCIGIN